MKFKFILLYFWAAFSFGNEVITLTNGEWPPWSSLHLRHYGVASHIVKDVFKDAGYDIIYVFLDWTSAYELAKSKYDGSIVWHKNAEREKHFYFSDPLITGDTVFFYRKLSRVKWKTYEDLKGVKVGITEGYYYGKEFQDAVDKKLFDAVTIKTDEESMFMLLNREIDLAVMEVNTGFSILNSNFSREQIYFVDFHPKSINVAPYHLLLNKQNKDNKKIMEKFNQSLAKMAKNETIKKYLENSRKGLYEVNK